MSLNDRDNTTRAFDSYMQHSSGFTSPLQHFLAGVAYGFSPEYAASKAAESAESAAYPITLRAYLRARHPKIDALTAAEAKILGIGYPLRSGWAKAEIWITSAMHAALVDARKKRYAIVRKSK